MQIIVIDDNKSGHKSQLLGVVHFLADAKQITKFSITPSILNYLSYGLFKIFLSKTSKNQLYNLLDCNEQEIKIISIGSKTLWTSLFIKSYGVLQKKKVKLIYLMPPTKIKKYIKLIDLIFYHSYKKAPQNCYKSRYFPVLIAPHNIIEEKILQASQHNIIDFSPITQESLANKQKPIFGILIGGDANKIKFNYKAVDTLIRQMLEINQVKSCYFLITTSRRTKAKIADYLANQLALHKLDYYFHNFHKAEAKINPYLHILNYADNFIISGESVSMISEAICLNKNKRVYIFFNNDFYAKRYAKFHFNLLKEGYIKNSMEAKIDMENFDYNNFTKRAINPAIIMAETISKL